MTLTHILGNVYSRESYILSVGAMSKKCGFSQTPNHVILTRSVLRRPITSPLGLHVNYIRIKQMEMFFCSYSSKGQNKRTNKTYGVVPKGLTFLGSLYKEVAKTTSGTLVYRFERQTARKKSSFEKHCVFDLECRILAQEPSDSRILYFNVIFHGK